MKQQRNSAISKRVWAHTKPTSLPALQPACVPACRHTGRQAKTCQQALNVIEKLYGTKDGNRAIDFHQQDGQQMHNNEKMSDFLYFSEE